MFLIYISTEDDLYPHYPHIYALLDIDKLYPHLCREGLLNATEQNKLTKHERTREQKISKLLKMVSRKGSDAQRQFVDCVGQISGDDATQNKLYKILLNRDISKKGECLCPLSHVNIMNNQQTGLIVCALFNFDL